MAVCASPPSRSHALLTAASYSQVSVTLEIARANAVKGEFIRQAEHQAKEGRKAADVLADGVVVGVGLIRREEDK
ncbi:hypothetical protein J3R82DRAFT_7102 [Butyriboletus roseoflavus]|nr:hypothetical protein J3R82DRAFT_7102 [Butyriboletus roseoflavus]